MDVDRVEAVSAQPLVGVEQRRVDVQHAQVVEQVMDRFIVSGLVIGQGLDTASGQIAARLLQQIDQAAPSRKEAKDLLLREFGIRKQ